jgi:phosphate transport system permease protein
MEGARAELFVSDGRLRRRKIVNRATEVVATLASLLAVAVLLIVVVSVVRRGAGALDVDFFTKTQGLFGESGGLANAVVGSIVLVALATGFALPVGILIAIYVSELAPPKVASVVRLALDVTNGVPTIVTGIFVFSLLVAAHGQSGLAGAFALSIIALPLISRSTQEVLRLVPPALREAGLALGASRWRTVLGIILPTGVGGILTGTTLAIARVAGETAPLLFTSSLTAQAVTWDPRQPLQSLPLSIFQLSDSPDPADHERAWAAGIVLMGFVLVTSLAARGLLARTRRKLSQ